MTQQAAENEDPRKAMLDRIRANRAALNAPKQYQNFMPKTLDSVQVKTNPFDEISLQQIRNIGETATQDMRLRRLNSEAHAEQERQRRALIEARRRRREVENMPVTEIPFYQPDFSGHSNAPGGTAPHTNFGPNFDPEALTSFNWRGHTLHVNPVAVKPFRGLLNDLWKAGYRPKVIGSHNDRNIAGTNTPSLHSHGLAIDIDPGLNPVTRNGKMITALPKNVAAIARKWGLDWGGNWRSYKDPMHFSLPHGGRR